MDRERRQRELAEPVWRVIQREGVENASVRSVASEAGLSTGSLRHYFASQSELLQFAMQLVIDRLEARVAGIVVPADPLAAARTVLAELLPLDAAREAENQVWMAFTARAMVDEDLRGVRDDAYDRLRHASRRWVGRLLPGATAERQALEAERLFALIDGLAVHAAIRPGETSRDQLVAVLDLHLEQLVSLSEREG